MVYPTLLAAVGDAAPPERRASTVGVYRFWRDAGYSLGALGAGLAADTLGLNWAIGATALLTLLSGLQVAITMPKGGVSWPSPAR
jgi:MFS family permease